MLDVNMWACITDRSDAPDRNRPSGPGRHPDPQVRGELLSGPGPLAPTPAAARTGAAVTVIRRHSYRSRSGPPR